MVYAREEGNDFKIQACLSVDLIRTACKAHVDSLSRNWRECSSTTYLLWINEKGQ